MNIFFEHTNLLTARRALVSASVFLFLTSFFDISFEQFDLFGATVEVNNKDLFSYLHLIIYYFLAVFLFRAYEKLHIIRAAHQKNVNACEIMKASYDDFVERGPAQHAYETEVKNRKIAFDQASHTKRTTGNSMISFIFIEVFPVLMFFGFALTVYYCS